MRQVRTQPNTMSKEEYSSGCISRANLQFSLKSSEKTKKRVFKNTFRKLNDLADFEKLTEPGFSELARESFNIQMNMKSEKSSYLGLPLSNQVMPYSAKTSCDRTAS